MSVRAMDGRDIIIGRSPSCDVSLPDDPVASRRHAILTMAEGAYVVIDLGSSNGTQLNDVEIQGEAVLHDGDRLTVGTHTFRIQAVPAASLAAGARQPGTGPLSPADEGPIAPSAGGQVATASGESVGGDGERAFAQQASPPAIAAGSEAGAAGTDSLGATGTQDIVELRALFLEILRVVRRQADEEASAAKAMRTVLIQTRDELAQVLQGQSELVGAPDRLAELTMKLRQAANHAASAGQAGASTMQAHDFELAAVALERLGAEHDALAQLHTRLVNVASEQASRKTRQD